MKANISYKFRIYPDEIQKEKIQTNFDCARFVYNYYLGKNKEEYENGTASGFSAFDCMRDLTQLKKNEQYAFLNRADRSALDCSILNLEKAFQAFFRQAKKTKESKTSGEYYFHKHGFPRFKSQYDGKKSYTTCQNANCKPSLRIEDGKLRLPKMGLVKIALHREIPDGYLIKNATVSQTASGEYYVSLLLEYETNVKPVETESFLGLNYSMKELYVDSNGNKPDYPGYYRQMEDKLAKEQRKLSRMVKHSENYKKQRKKIAKIHEKIANQRKDFLHKQSKMITDKCDCLCVEDLDMAHMAAMPHWGKSVHDNGYGLFTQFSEYKLRIKGKKFVKINKFFPSTQTCSNCGYRNPQTKNLKLQEWTCPQCGTHHDRDINAAINIRNEGMRLINA